MPNKSSETCVPSTRSSDNRLISQDGRFEVKVEGKEEERNVDEILDELTDNEFFK